MKPLLTTALVAIVALGVPASATAQRLARPFRCDGCISNYFYFDHGGREDWNCGSSTYPGHDGADFSLRGGVDAIDGGYAVRASADGRVIAAVDGNYDRCRIGALSECESGTRCTYGTANYVVIRHADRTTRYVHLRRGSVRVAMDDRVTCGQIIGEIGSSGCTTNAHLHFEVRPRTDVDRAYDPFRGDCSPRTSSLWIRQGGYRGYPGLECPAEPEPEPMPEPDAGMMPEVDAGSPPGSDASVPMPADAAAPADDAGDVTPADAATPSIDAKPVDRDAGSHAARTAEGGCGCHVTARPASSAPAPSSLWILLVLISAASSGWRRRSAAAQCRGSAPAAR